MRRFRLAGANPRLAGWLVLGWSLLVAPGAFALDKPTGAPLVLSSIETEQGVPLAILSPDGKTPTCVTVRLHWNPAPQVGPNDEAETFDLDLPADSPGAAIFTAQLWNASLASALAWQQPWEGARWKILDTPATDGTGIDAALAVGMIATSARRPYPKDTLVIGSLRPDGSLGAVPRLDERLNVAAAAGITRVIIPSVQRFDTDSDGNVVNMVRRATELHLECVPVDNLVEATEAVMNDPLPDIALDATAPHYANDIASYIDDFAQREQFEVKSDIVFAPKEADLAHYPPRLAALWHQVYSDSDAAGQAYRAGQVYVAYRLYARAAGHMHGLNALIGQDSASFNVRAALADADDLRRQLHALVTPPAIDENDLESALLVAEMADWVYDLSAEIEGAELVTKQTFSQRSDATSAERDRAREEIVFASEEVEYLLKENDFFTGLLSHVAANPVPVDENAAHLLPQLIPAQLAAAEIFTEGIRPRANDLREGLLFDPRLAGYIDVLRETQAAWNARQRQKETASANPTPAPPVAGTATKLTSDTTVSVGFDPGNTYSPPHTLLGPSTPAKQLSDVAACLMWVNDDCEIAALDEKYLRLGGTIDPVTHEWRLKDRARLDSLLQMAETGAREGIAFAEKADVDTAVLAMIYEQAAQLRIQGDDASALEALRNFWRCALLGNMCWQLAHAPKAQPVDVTSLAPKKDDTKPAATPDSAKAEVKPADQTAANPPTPAPVVTPVPLINPAATAGPVVPPKALPVTAADTNSVAAPAPVATPAPVVTPVPANTPAAVAQAAVTPPAATNDIDTTHAPRALPVTDDTSPPPTSTNAPPVAVPVAPVATPTAVPVATPVAPVAIPVAPVATTTPAPTPAAAPADAAATGGDTTDMNNIPVAPVARTQDLAPDTNAAPAPAPGPAAPGPANP